MTRNLTKSLKAEAERLGFDLVAACPAVDASGFSNLIEWLDSGYAGEMEYIQRRKDAYRHPQFVLDGAVSLLMLGTSYNTRPAAPTNAGQGKISRYAWGKGDYHDLIHGRLKQLRKFAESLNPELVCRGVVDSAPLLEREFAQLAGLGWSAKNTLLINREIGSWFFISALLLNQPLEYDAPFVKNHCGTCTACLDACPTDAFVSPSVLDATKCISYLTIEHRSPIPIELRNQMGDWIFGCDVCQDVCPWNRKAPTTDEPCFQPTPNQNPVDLVSLFDLDDDSFRARFRKTPLWRSKRRGILRNAAIAMGNQPSGTNLVPLEKGLNDPEPLIRGASAWAIGQHIAHGFSPAKQLLVRRKPREADEDVLNEIELALA